MSGRRRARLSVSDRESRRGLLVAGFRLITLCLVGDLLPWGVPGGPGRCWPWAGRCPDARVRRDSAVVCPAPRTGGPGQAEPLHPEGPVLPALRQQALHRGAGTPARRTRRAL